MMERGGVSGHVEKSREHASIDRPALLFDITPRPLRRWA